MRLMVLYIMMYRLNARRTNCFCIFEGLAPAQ